MANYSKIIPFDLAIKLRDVGYPQDECGEGYDRDGYLTSYYWKTYACPLYAQVLDWLIEQGMCVSVYALNLSDGVKWISSLQDIKDNGFDGSFGYRNTFDDAIIPAIEKALELIHENT